MSKIRILGGKTNQHLNNVGARGTVPRLGAGRRYMQYNPEIHHRKSIRLKNYDYGKKGMYFITICTLNRENTLSQIVGARGTVPWTKNKYKIYKNPIIRNWKICKE